MAVRSLRRRDHNPFTNGASLVVCGVLAGVVVAAAAFPAVAMSGLAAKAGAEAFDQLPSELTVRRSPQITYVYANDGKTLLTTLYDENRLDVPLNDVAPIMRKAMIAAEDQRFYQHNGVDIQGVARAFVANQQQGEVSQGASTITMQYVRLAISYSASNPQQVIDASADTNARKLREMRYALAVEKQLTKDQILERYLNIAAFGNSAFGIYAASQVYFGKAPKDLKLEEAAVLAGLVQAPSAYNPALAENKKAATERRDWVLSQMVKTNAITQAEYDTARATEIKVTGKPSPNGCVNTTTPSWGFLCDFFVRWWMEQDAFGKTAFEREERLKTGGYTIISSLDPPTQNAMKNTIEKYLPTINAKTKKPEWRALMLAAVEPGTGKVRALAVNRNYKLDDPAAPVNGISTDVAKARLGIRGTYPNTTNPLLSGGGDIQGYQAGSTFKIFTMVAALEKGYPLDYTINTTSPYISKFIIDTKSDAACQGNHYCPVNANPGFMNGPRNMWTGFGRSVNTYFVPLEERVGADNAVDVAKRFGIKFRARSNDPRFPRDYELSQPEAAKQWGAFTLGVSATTPLELANAYATIAADGKYCEPIPVEEIRDHGGNKLDVANPRCGTATRPDVAKAAIDAARCPIGDQSFGNHCDGNTYANGRNLAQKYGKFPVAGKTGTTDEDKTAALVMMTRQLTVGGIIGDPDTPQLPRDPATGKIEKFSHDQVNPAVAETLGAAMQGKKPIPFDPPTPQMALGTQVNIPVVTCQAVDAAKSILSRAGFLPELDRGKPIASPCPLGTVAKTEPNGRTVKGGVVVIFISAGPGAAAPPPGGGGPGNGGGGGGGGGGPGRRICLPTICVPGTGVEPD